MEITTYVLFVIGLILLVILGLLITGIMYSKQQKANNIQANATAEVEPAYKSNGRNSKAIAIALATEKFGVTASNYKAAKISPDLVDKLKAEYNLVLHYEGVANENKTEIWEVTGQEGTVAIMHIDYRTSLGEAKAYQTVEGGEKVYYEQLISDIVVYWDREVDQSKIVNSISSVNIEYPKGKINPNMRVSTISKDSDGVHIGGTRFVKVKTLLDEVSYLFGKAVAFDKTYKVSLISPFIAKVAAQGGNFIIGGKAGTGKTTLVTAIVDALQKEHDVTILEVTGDDFKNLTYSQLVSLLKEKEEDKPVEYAVVIDQADSLLERYSDKLTQLLGGMNKLNASFFLCHNKTKAELMDISPEVASMFRPGRADHIELLPLSGDEIDRAVSYLTSHMTDEEKEVAKAAVNSIVVDKTDWSPEGQAVLAEIVDNIKLKKQPLSFRQMLDKE